MRIQTNKDLETAINNKMIIGGMFLYGYKFIKYDMEYHNQFSIIFVDRDANHKIIDRDIDKNDKSNYEQYPKEFVAFKTKKEYLKWKNK